MTFAEIIAKIAAMDGGEEMVSGIQAEITKKNGEAQNLRTRLKENEVALKTAKATLKDFLKAIGVDEEGAAADDFDLDNALEAHINKIQEGKGKGKDSPEFVELQKQVKTLTKSVEKLSEENTTLKSSVDSERGKRHGALKETALMKALEANKAVKPGFLAKSLLSSVRIDEVDGKDTLVYIDDKGDEVTIDEGIKAFLTANPELVLNGQTGGAGSTGGSPGGKATDADRGKDTAKQRNEATTNSIQPGLDVWGSQTQQ